MEDSTARARSIYIAKFVGGQILRSVDLVLSLRAQNTHTVRLTIQSGQLGLCHAIRITRTEIQISQCSDYGLGWTM